MIFKESKRSLFFNGFIFKWYFSPTIVLETPSISEKNINIRSIDSLKGFYKHVLNVTVLVFSFIYLKT